MVTTPGDSSDRRDGSSTGEEEEEATIGDKEVDVIGMERKLIVDMLFLSLLPKQKMMRKNRKYQNSRGC